MELISRKVAEQHGSIVYFTGKPCRNGHITHRYVGSGLCRACSQAYAKKYAENHPGRISKRTKRWIQLRREDPRVWAWRLISAIKYRARKLNVPFDLSAEHIFSLIPKDGLCPALKIPLVFGEIRNDNSMSIDRVNQERGYVVGNVAIISFRANKLKGNSTGSHELRQIADYIDKFEKKQ